MAKLRTKNLKPDTEIINKKIKCLLCFVFFFSSVSKMACDGVVSSQSKLIYQCYGYWVLFWTVKSFILSCQHRLIIVVRKIMGSFKIGRFR